MTRYPKSGKGRRWTALELKAISAAWKGDTLSDGDGLVGEVRAGADGAVSVAFRYGFKWEGRKAWHYCGAWPAASMEGIRAERDRARGRVKEGVKPTDAKRADRIEAQAKVAAVIAEAERKDAERLPFRTMFDAWLADGVARADGNAELRRTFEKDIIPAIGDKPVRELTDAHLRDALRKVGQLRGRGRTAERMLTELRQLFRWAEKRKPWRALMIEGNPAALVDLKMVVPQGYEAGIRDRVLSPDEIRELRAAFEKAEAAYHAAPNKRSADRPVQKETQIAVWLCLSTACRIGELLQARWEHVNLETGEWFVPRENTKTKTEWKVFLSPFALRQFKALHDLTGQSEWCFPARAIGRQRDGAPPAETHVCLKSVAKQIGDRQMRFKQRSGPLKHRRHDDSLVLADGANGEWTPHDLRRSAATMMQQLGILPDVIDRCQNHVLAGSKVRRHYLHHDFAQEKRDAWDKLGQRIEAILAPNVVLMPMKGAA